MALLGAAPAEAQPDSRWAITGTFVPQWAVPGKAGDFIDAEVDVSGREFRVGIGRGRTESGDWAISFVQKTVKDGSQIREIDDDPFCSNGQCYDTSGSFALNGVKATGVEIHKMWHIATIKDRIQIGMDFAAGVAHLSGETIETEADLRFANNGAVSVVSTTTTKPVELEWAPLARIELAVTGIVSKALKVRVSGGFNLPGVPAIAVTALYLIGSD
jgi:hypothetical protein